MFKREKPVEVQVIEGGADGVHRRLNAPGNDYTDAQRADATRATSAAMAERRAAMAALDNGDQAGYQRLVDQAEQHIREAELIVPQE